MASKSFPASLVQTPYYQAIAAEFQPERLAPSFIAGMITGIIGVIRAISYAALIFSGPLADELNTGVGIAVLSSALISIVVALTSSLSGMIATPLAAPTVVLTMLAARIAQHPTITDTTTLVTTVIAAIALGSILTGTTLWLLGQLQWGKAMEFLPYPVVGGFMAGTGLLLVRGAFKVMTDSDLAWRHLDDLSTGAASPKWLTGMAIAVVLLWTTKRIHHYLVMPTVLFAAALLFYGVMAGLQLPFEQVQQQGWLLGPFSGSDLWHPLTPHGAVFIQWSAIAEASGLIGLLVFVSLISLVLTNGSIELAVEKDLDLNRELKAVGLANVVAGLGSTMAGNQALPSTLLVHRMGAANRLTGLFKTLPCFTVLILGPTFLNYFPKPILGSVLLFLGLDLLWKWLYKAWFQLSLWDYSIICMTLVVINVAGFLPGIGVGFGLAMVQFLIHCGQLKVLTIGASAPAALDALVPPESLGDRVTDSTAQTRSQAVVSIDLESSVSSSPAIASPTLHSPDTALAGVALAELQGLLFFGTAKRVCKQLCDAILHPQNGTLQYLIVDFEQVLTLDASAIMGIGRVLSVAEKHDCTVIFSHLTDTFQHQLDRGIVLEPGAVAPTIVCDRIAALQWCQTHHSDREATPEPAAKALQTA